MFTKNRNFLIIALIAVVNALGYGIIIPIQFSYVERFGLTVFQNGLLFALFSICQFLSTPIIGRLSDLYGRKPLLLGSLFGTAVSFLVMAFAPNATFLFLARALDGITAGNIPVATAVISDTTSMKDRAKGFGVIGASFGFGFLFGPIIAGLTVGIAPNLPFIIASSISFLAVVLTAFLLPETNKHIGEITQKELFNLKKLVSAAFDSKVGTTLLITLFHSFAFSMFIVTYQPFLSLNLKLTAAQSASVFVMFGVIGIVMQSLFVQRFLNLFGLKRGLFIALSGLTLSFAGLFLAKTVTAFVFTSAICGIFNSMANPLLHTTLPRATDEKSQGSIFGVNASYMSVGQIIGPVVAGGVATIGVSYPFLLGAFLIDLCCLLSRRVFVQAK